MSEVRPPNLPASFLARVHRLKGDRATPAEVEEAQRGWRHGLWKSPETAAQLLDALAKLQASVGRSANACTLLSRHYCDPREVDLFNALGGELRYAAEAIGAIRIVIGGGR